MSTDPDPIDARDLAVDQAREPTVSEATLLELRRRLLELRAGTEGTTRDHYCEAIAATHAALSHRRKERETP